MHDAQGTQTQALYQTEQINQENHKHKTTVQIQCLYWHQRKRDGWMDGDAGETVDMKPKIL